jgi:chemotaxis protein methyltransferase CheR
MSGWYGLAIGDSSRGNLSTALAMAAAGRHLEPHRCCELAKLGDDQLRQAFISAVTIHETYFFRHPEQFDLLRALAEQRVREELRAPLRALSAGCASGEEAYSIASALYSAAQGVRSPPAIEVLGIDIDRSSLEKARGARYGGWSVREALPPWASGALHGSSSGWEVTSELRAVVRFYSLNLHDSFLALLLAQDSPFDFIFLRNVLMYLVPPAASRVAQQLAHLVSPNGYLIVSPLDIERVPEEFQGHPSNPTFLSRLAPNSSPGRSAEPGRAAEPDSPRSASVASSKGQLGTMLAEAKRLTDGGELTRAKAICAELLRHYPDVPAALFLAALVELESGGWDAAERLLQGALHREPDFALAHFALATLLQRQGRRNEARARLVRLSHLLAGIPSESVLAGPEGIRCGWLRSLVSDHLSG